MKRMATIAAMLACACVAAAWIFQFRYGIGSCGPASDTPILCLIFGMGPFYCLVSMPGMARVVDAVPNLVGVGMAFVLPVLLWFGVFFGALSFGRWAKKRMADQSRK
jgi:hypothetical protein